LALFKAAKRGTVLELTQSTSAYFAFRLSRQLTIHQRWTLAKQAVWLLLLTVSFLIFYLIDIMQQSIAIEMTRL
jgi:hypothetical protein